MKRKKGSLIHGKIVDTSKSKADPTMRMTKEEFVKWYNSTHIVRSTKNRQGSITMGGYI